MSMSYTKSRELKNTPNAVNLEIKGQSLKKSLAHFDELISVKVRNCPKSEKSM
jgi:hypothetical protein